MSALTRGSRIQLDSAQLHTRPMVDILLSKMPNGEISSEELAEDVAAIALAGTPRCLWDGHRGSNAGLLIAGADTVCWPTTDRSTGLLLMYGIPL